MGCAAVEGPTGTPAGVVYATWVCSYPAGCSAWSGGRGRRWTRQKTDRVTKMETHQPILFWKQGKSTNDCSSLPFEWDPCGRGGQGSKSNANGEGFCPNNHYSKYVRTYFRVHATRSDQMVDEVEKASALELNRYAWSRDHKTPAGGISNQARVE